MCLNVKFIVKMVKKMFLAADLGHISRVQSRGPGQRLWLSNIPGRAKSRLRPKVRPGFFWPGLARLLASGRNRHITTSTLLSFRRKKNRDLVADRKAEIGDFGKVILGDCQGLPGCSVDIGCAVATWH